MSTFSAVLSALGLAPKTLPQANETLTQAKGTLDSVAALFTAAGLNLEQMLAAGPDSLKAHLDSFDNADALAAALLENKQLATDRDSLQAKCATYEGVLAANGEIFKAMGFIMDGKQDPKATFDAHVSKQTTLALAKTGHPPAHVPVTDAAPAVKTDADLAQEYQAMSPGPERLAFYSKHEVALNRFARSLRKPE